MKNSRPVWRLALQTSVICWALCGCGNRAKPRSADEAKIYAADDVEEELKEGQVVLGGTREDAQAFFRTHANYQVCEDREIFSVAVVRNSKVDKRADDIYVITNYGRDGRISGMEIGPPQFSVNHPASYCK
jgi:hypothetical protein